MTTTMLLVSACSTALPCAVDDECPIGTHCTADGACAATLVRVDDPSLPAAREPAPIDGTLTLTPALDDIDAPVPPPIAPEPTSCADILATLGAENASDGEYTIVGAGGVERRVLCDMQNGGWTRVHRFDVTELGPDDECPEGLGGVGPFRCGLALDDDEATFLLPVPLSSYREIRGDLQAVAVGNARAFHRPGATRLEHAYVDGVSLTTTNGEHLWTFAAGLSSDVLNSYWEWASQDDGFLNVAIASRCPCAQGAQAPAFVDGHFSCEGDNWLAGPGEEDPLWDALQVDSACASAPEAQRGFTRVLDGDAAGDIAVRVMTGVDVSLLLGRYDVWVR